MSVQDKNAVKFDSNGNPSDLVRGCLVKLFGRDVLETSNLTAVGTKQGIRGIKKEVRDAIMGMCLCKSTYVSKCLKRNQKCWHTY